MAKKDLASGQRVVPPLGSDSDAALFRSTPHARENREPSTACHPPTSPPCRCVNRAWRTSSAGGRRPRRAARAAFHSTRGRRSRRRRLLENLEPAGLARGDYPRCGLGEPARRFFPREKDTAACRKWGRPGRAVVLPRSERPVSGDGDSTHSIRAHGLPAETSGRLFSPSVGKERGDDQI